MRYSIVFCLIPYVFSLITLPFNGTISQWFNRTISNNMEYLIEFTIQNQGQPRVIVTSPDALEQSPLVVVARFQDQVTSWHVPLVVHGHDEHMVFNKTAKTLCPIISNYSKNQQKLVISLSTSMNNITFNLKVEYVNAIVSTSVLYNITVTPSEPLVYFYNFPLDGATIDSVLVKAESEDGVCAVFSIQDVQCPIFDLSDQVTFQGYWGTFSHQGGITVSKERFPNGFFIIFVPKPDDFDCFEETTTRMSISREKQLQFIIKPRINQIHYIIAMITTIVLSLLIIIWIMLCSNNACAPRTMEYINDNQIPSTISPIELSDKLSFGIMEYVFLSEIVYDSKTIANKSVLYLSDLARKDPRIFKKNSNLYLWYVVTVALFYGFPIVQLVISYQKVVNDTGNQDLCYYNFLCAHPLGFLTDFNHVFSNLGYFIFGLLFLQFVRKRERLHNDLTFEKLYGIPQHYGLFYAMGVALLMEGVLSAAYHICPSQSNFQFDSSFMYVMAVLCMVKLYQTRHPDVNASAYTTFSVLAIAMFLGLISVVGTSIYFWIVFIILHLSACFALTIQVYYFGSWKIEKATIKRMWKEFHCNFKIPKPARKSRMVLVLLGNVHNWILAYVGLKYNLEFASYLQLVLVTNALLYFFFYVIMKLIHGEKLNKQTLTYGALNITLFLCSFYFLGNRPNSWDVTPALSKEFNQECDLLGFYDHHDIWHFLSALGMFFNFMMLFTLDDDLTHIPRSKIIVF